MRDQSFGSASPKVVDRKHIVDMAFLIPSSLRKCWIWKDFVAFDRTANMQGIGIVVYCTGQSTLLARPSFLTQVSGDRLYAGAGQIENPHCPQKSHSSVM